MQLPPDVSLSVEPQTIVAGQSATLSWSAANAESCVIAPDIGEVPVNGNVQVAPLQDTTYVVTAYDPGGSASTNIIIAVTEPAGPPTVQLTPSETTITLGQSVTLSWTSSNADKAHIDNGVVVQLLDTDADGRVDALDADGDGLADDLDQDGTYSNEVIGLEESSRYAPGDAFWRSEISHFTPLVYNTSRVEVDRSFARFGSPAGIEASQGRSDAVVWKTFYMHVYPPSLPQYQSNMGDGWSLDKHHPASKKEDRRLSKGDGSIIETIKEKYIYNYLDIASLISTFAGNNKVSGLSGDGGPATQAQLYNPNAVVADKSGNLLILDMWNHNIRKVDPNGIIKTIAGTGAEGFGGDGGPADQALLYYPYDMAIDVVGNIYIADSYNHRIRKIDSNGIITTIAGRGEPTFIAGSDCDMEICPKVPDYELGDNGPATEAYLYYPESVALDNFGNVYIADVGHNRIRKIDPDGIIVTIAGNGEPGHGQDGASGPDSPVSSPGAIYLDSQGSIYFVEDYYHIRKIDSSGKMSTVLKNESTIADIIVDAMGNLYLAEKGNHRIVKVKSDGATSVIVGTGEYGRRTPDDIGDGGRAVNAHLSSPKGLAFDPEGNLYIAQRRCVRKCAPPAPAVFMDGINGSVYTEPNGLGHVISDAALHTQTIDLTTGVALRSFEYNDNRKLLSITDRFGRRTGILRNSQDRPYAIISPDGLRTELTIDGNNHLTRIALPDGNAYGFEYTPEGLMTAEIEPAGNRFEHLYDKGGRITDVIDEEGGRWQYSRDEQAGNITAAVTTAEGNTVSYQDRTDSSRSMMSLITDANGEQTRYEHLFAADIVEKSLPCGTALHFEYNFDPRYNFKFVKLSTETLPSLFSRKTETEKIYQDTNGDTVPDLITDIVTVNDKSTTITQDVIQSFKTITTPENRSITTTYDPDTLLTLTTSIPGLYETNYGYDAEGRLIATQTGTRQAAYAYNEQGFIDAITDPGGRTTLFSYDPMGRVTGATRPDGSLVDFIYDPNGNMTVLTTPRSADHDFNYNRVNLRSGHQTPLSGSYSYLYDKDRRLIRTNFPSGKQIRNIYTDARLTQIQTPEDYIDLTYSCGGNVASMTKGGESIAYAYDGKLLTDVTLSGTLNRSLNFTYNNDFNPTAMTYAGATEYFYYDLDGLLTGAGEYTISRNAGNGLPESVSGNGLSVSRSFNGYGETAAQTVSVGSQPMLQWSLTRDNAGRITAKTETADGETHNYAYSYDAMGRLLTVTLDGELVESYSYDLSGTRISETNTKRDISNRAFGYSDEDHLLTAGDAVYNYDADGYLTSKTVSGKTTTFDYSTRGELLEVLLPDGRIIAYDHDPIGRRIAKRIDGVIVEKYLWQGLTKLLAVYDGSDILKQRFQYAGDRMPVAMTMEGVRYYPAYDQVGSLRIVADGAGNVVKRIDYDAFGNIISDSNPDMAVPFGFGGGLYDRDIGLVRFGYRDYDPDTGRWTAKDPIGFEGGDTDLFGYVQNDPVNLIDPYGLFWAEFGQGFSNSIANNAWESGKTPYFILAISEGFAEVLKGWIENKPSEFQPWKPWPVEFFLEPYLEQKKLEKLGDWPKPKNDPC